MGCVLKLVGQVRPEVKNNICWSDPKHRGRQNRYEWNPSRDQSEAKVRRMDTFQTEALSKKDKEITRLRADLGRMKERLSAIDQEWADLQALRATPMQCAVCRPIRGPS